jgi:hypothetical protein
MSAENVELAWEVGTHHGERAPTLAAAGVRE